MKACGYTPSRSFGWQHVRIAGAALLAALALVILALWLASSQAALAAPRFEEQTPAGSLAVPAVGNLFWTVETVDDPKQFSELKMSEYMLRLDGNGHPHVVYGEDHLYYATNDGGGWRIETVDKANNVGAYASLALDAEGHPHIAYYDDADMQGLDDTQYGLKYAYWTGSAWEIQTVDSLGREWTAIALDPEGHPHIAYAAYCDNDKCLKYAHWTGTQWEFRVVDDTDQYGRYISLDVETVAPYKAHILYRNIPDNPTLRKYAHWTGSAWNIQNLTDIVSYCEMGVVLLDNSNTPHIACWGYGLNLARWTGSEWSVETIDSKGGYTSFAFGEDGHPRFVYEANGGSQIRYAYWNGSAWNNEVLTYTESANLSMGVHGDDVHFAYYHHLGTLMYAKLTGGTRMFETLDTTGQIVEGSASLAMDGSDRPHLSYADGQKIKYAHWISATWEIDEVDEGSIYPNALDLEASAPYTAHLLYTAPGPVWNWKYLTYARQTNAGWDIQTLDADVGGVALALDRQGYPHIVYAQGVSSPTVNLILGAWSGTQWVSQTITAGTSADVHALALDRSDRPHIIFSNHDSHYYGRWTGSQWEFASIMGSRHSLALDDSDHPHMVFVKPSMNYGIGYGTWDGSSAWQYDELPGDESSVPQKASVVVDASGAPHISYPCKLSGSSVFLWMCHTYGTSLPYPNNWLTVIVDPATASGRGSTIALDGAGVPYMAYLNLFYNDLYFAWPHPLQKVFLPVIARR